MSALTGQLQDMQRLLAEAESKMAIQLKGYERISAQKTDMVVNAAKMLGPAIHYELGISYSKSGLGVDSGQLRLAVASSTMLIRPNGIKLQLPSGKPGKFYIYSSAQQYGWVTGKGGKRLKAKLKKIGAKVPGMKVHSGKRYYTLKADQTARLSGELVKYMQPMVTKASGG